MVTANPCERSMQPSKNTAGMNPTTPRMTESPVRRIPTQIKDQLEELRNSFTTNTSLSHMTSWHIWYNCAIFATDFPSPSRTKDDHISSRKLNLRIKCFSHDPQSQGCWYFPTHMNAYNHGHGSNPPLSCSHSPPPKINYPIECVFFNDPQS